MYDLRPTMNMDVDIEKKRIYEPTFDYLKNLYNLNRIEVLVSSLEVEEQQHNIL